jgi:hypothetical protein
MAVKPRYTEQVVLLVTPETRKELEVIAEAEEKSLAGVARELLDSALSARVASD